LHREQLAMRAMQMIQRDLSRELSVERLADELGVSWSTLAHVFPRVVGETLWQCAKRLRLERAAYNLLSRRSTPILDVALASGFESQAAFSRAFKQAFGCSPTRFRQRPDAHPILSAPSGVHIDSAGELTPWAPVTRRHEPLDVRIERRPDIHLAFVRGLGEYEFDHFASVLLKLLLAAARHGLLCPARRIFSVMYEDPYLAADGQIAYDACVSVSADFLPVGPFGKTTLPAGTWACVDCCGPPKQHYASWETFVLDWQIDSPWTMSHPMTVNEFHCPPELLADPPALVESLKLQHAATNAIAVKPWPSGSLLPL
jgi:AraC family transcriptional regulator